MSKVPRRSLATQIAAERRADDRRKPLNGEKTHPLKPGSIRVLELLLREGPQPRHEINAGVIDRLTREDLIEPVMATPRHHNRLYRCYRITDAGRAKLEEMDK